MAVGTADLGTAGSIQTGAAHRFTLRYRIAQRMSQHIIRNRKAEEIKNGGRQINGLDQAVTAARGPASGIIDKQWCMYNLFVVVDMVALCPPVMFSQHKAMIRVNDKHGVFPQVIFVHFIQNPAQAAVAHPEKGSIFIAYMPDIRLLLLRYGMIARPVEKWAVIFRLKAHEILILYIEGLVRIKGLHLKEPVIVFMVSVQKFDSGLEGLGLCHFFHGIRVFPVHHVLLNALSQMRRQFFLTYAGLPVIPLLTAHIFPAAVSVMIGAASILPIMIVVADQMAVNAVFLQDFRHGIIVGLHGAPASVQEIVTSCVDFPPCGHTGKASHIAFVKRDAAVRKAFEIRGLCPVTAVWGKHVTVQGIVHYHDCFHNFSPSLLICSN